MTGQDTVLSDAVDSYALGGFLRLKGGVLKLYEDRIELSKLFYTATIQLTDLEYVKPTKIIGFAPWGLEIKSKQGKILRVYFSNIFIASCNREKWLCALERYVFRG